MAEKFGKNDFRVILMARNEEHLAAYEKEFKEKGIEVYTKVVDAAKPYMVTEAFNELKTRFGTPDVLFYNVGITGLDSEMKVSKDFDLLMERYKVDVTGADIGYHMVWWNTAFGWRMAVLLPGHILYEENGNQNKFLN